jgi:L-lactate dehydrogenase
VVSSAQDIISTKGFSATGIAFTVSKLVDKVLRDSNSVVPVSTSVKGLYGIEEDVYLSVPCVIGAGGVKRVFHFEMNPQEEQALRDFAVLQRLVFF